MAHLAQVANEVRIILKLLAASFVVVSLLFIFLRGGELAKNLFFPTPPPPPEEKFGKLPVVTFPAQNQVDFEYKINTLTGRLPSFADRLKVYKVKKKEPSLVALKSSRDRLRLLGYTENESKISEEEYQWSNSSGQTIRVNILTGNFKIFSNFLSEEAVPITGEIARKEGAYEVVSRLLGNLDLEIEDLDQNISTLTYYKQENGTLVRALSLNDANYGRLDLFQKNLDGSDDSKIYYPKLSESPMYFMLKSGSSSSNIIEGSFHHSIPDLSNTSTYPIKTAEAAFEDLKKGNALIFAANPNETLIDITDVSLGYYIGEDQQYFLPIVVFKGNGFTAYVQAVP